MLKKIAVANQKGGVGKTTTSVNLACYLAMEGRRVLLVDLDPQGNSTSGLGLDRHSLQKTVRNVLSESARIADVLCLTPIRGLDLVASNNDTTEAEVFLLRQPEGKSRLKEALDEYSVSVQSKSSPNSSEANVDYVIMDCPPSLGLLTVNALMAADSLLLPVQCEYYAMEGLTDLLRTFTAIKQEFNPALRLEGIVLTMADARTNLSKEVGEEIRHHYGRHVFETAIPRSVRLSEAPSHGQPIAVYAPGSSAAQAYRSLAMEVIAHEKESVG